MAQNYPGSRYIVVVMMIVMVIWWFIGVCWFGAPQRLSRPLASPFTSLLFICLTPSPCRPSPYPPSPCRPSPCRPSPGRHRECWCVMASDYQAVTRSSTAEGRQVKAEELNAGDNTTTYHCSSVWEPVMRASYLSPFTLECPSRTSHEHF